MKYIDAEKLIVEIEKRKNQTEHRLDNIVPIRRKDTMDEEQLAKIELRDKVDKAYLNGVLTTLSDILSFITPLQQERQEANKVEKALSLQIQAYLTTASDELYAPGKPLYTKEHHEGIHECMKMWQKLHRYYFSTKEEQPEVDLDAIVNETFDKYSSVDGYGQLSVSFNRAELYSFIKKITRKEK